MNADIALIYALCSWLTCDSILIFKSVNYLLNLN